MTDIIYKAVNDINNKYSNLRIDKILEYGGVYYTIELVGGLNSDGDWRDYLSDIQELLDNLNESFETVYIVDLDSDPLDDMFYLTVRALKNC